MKKLSVVIPTYNEEKNVDLLYKELSDVLSYMGKKYEILFIDDGSTDGTFKRLSEIREKDNNVKIIKFKRNFGQSAALKAGFDHARADIIVTIDADLQNDPKDIPKLLGELEKNDVVCGWRSDRKDSFAKKFFSNFGNWLRKRLIGGEIHDSGCTLRAYKRECVDNLELYGEMHRYMPALLSWKGYKICEVKVNHRKRKYEKTKYNWKRLFKGFMDIINTWFWQKYSQRPLHIFGGLGILSLAIGSMAGLYSIYLKIFEKVSLSDTALPLFAVFMIMIGVQFFISGLLADISVKNYYYSEKRKTYSIEKILK